MLADDELSFMEELPADEPFELLRTMPEVRQSSCDGKEEGLRAILERPNVLSRVWRRVQREARREGGGA